MKILKMILINWNNETSEEQKEFELEKQRKEIADLQGEIQGMEEKIREGQEELDNLDLGRKMYDPS